MEQYTAPAQDHGTCCLQTALHDVYHIICVSSMWCYVVVRHVYQLCYTTLCDMIFDYLMLQYDTIFYVVQ